jgi:hypothetical protein
MRTEQEIRQRINELDDTYRIIDAQIIDIYGDWSLKRDHLLHELQFERGKIISKKQALLWVLELNND